MTVVNLSLSVQSLLEQTKEHPMRAMTSLGIKFQMAVPQTISDSWWFLNCASVPSTLPSYLKEMKIKNYNDLIGNGLSQEDVDLLNGKIGEVELKARKILKDLLDFAKEQNIKKISAPYWLCAIGFPKEKEE